MKKRIPGQFHPGEYIKEEMEARGWTPNELARRMDFGLSIVKGLCRGERRVTRLTAQALGRAFGTEAEVWLNLQAAYDKGGEKK